MASLIDSSDDKTTKNARYIWEDIENKPDAPGAPMFTRHTSVETTKPIKAMAPILVCYGREYDASIFAGLRKGQKEQLEAEGAEAISAKVRSLHLEFRVWHSQKLLCFLDATRPEYHLA